MVGFLDDLDHFCGDYLVNTQAYKTWTLIRVVQILFTTFFVKLNHIFACTKLKGKVLLRGKVFLTKSLLRIKQLGNLIKFAIFLATVTSNSQFEITFLLIALTILLVSSLSKNIKHILKQSGR